MNLFDVLIVLILLAGSAWGFIKGVIHQLFGVGMIYVAIVVATVLYATVAPWLAYFVRLSAQAAGALAFLLLLIITINLLALALSEWRKKEIKILRLINQLGGMVLGFGLACVWIALGIALLHYAVAGPMEWHQAGKPVLLNLRSESIRQAIISGLAYSPLVNAFSVLLPMILTSVSPFAPTQEVLRIFVVR